MVVVEDVLAHTFWKAQHMATVHFENGHYHIHTELADISKKENKASQEKSSSSEKSNENVKQNIHELNFTFQTTGIKITNTLYQTQNILSGYKLINFPPPKNA